MHAIACGDVMSLDARYKKIKVLGRGSFGTVWLVHRRRTDDSSDFGISRGRTNLASSTNARTGSSSRRPSASTGAEYVAKEIAVTNQNPALAKQLEELAAKEVRVLAKLDHPNVVKYVEQVSEADKLCIVMEYCPGGDLKSFLEKRSTDRSYLPEAEILSMFRQLLRATAYIHEQRLIHRDIKTANIFRSRSGRLKLGDFGLTKDEVGTVAMANTVCGTPMYYSPELCRQTAYNSKTDIWALGCVFYEIMALRHPFAGISMRDLAKRIVDLKYDDPNPAGRLYARDIAHVITQYMLCPVNARYSATTLLKIPALQRDEPPAEESRSLASAPHGRDGDIAAAHSPAFPTTSPGRRPGVQRQPPALSPGPRPHVRGNNKPLLPPAPAHKPVTAPHPATGAAHRDAEPLQTYAREARLDRLLADSRLDIVAALRDPNERKAKLRECDEVIDTIRAYCGHPAPTSQELAVNSTDKLQFAERVVTLLGDRCTETVFQDVCVVVGIAKRPR
jgi:serine/threonine protein kinase